MTLVINRILSNLNASLMRFLKDTPYQVGAVTGTLITHFPLVAILNGFPDDLTKLTLPSLGIVAPIGVQTTDWLYGEGENEQVISGDVYGFVVGQGRSGSSTIYRDRLLNDVFWLFDRVGRDEGIPLYDQATKAEIGRFEVIRATGRTLPANIDLVEAEKYKFQVSVDMEYDSDAILAS